MEIIVCPLNLAPSVASEKGISHAISLLDPYDRFPSLHPLTDESHLKIGVHDIDELIMGLTLPETHHVESLLTFAQSWDRSAPLLVHCWAGISRSTASAFTIACALNPEALEIDIALALRNASHTASPNLRIVALADQVLGRGGRMSKAVASIGRGTFAERAEPFSIPAFYDAPATGGG
ncbi:MAG: hypothetical protein ABWZ40_01150 [Caulobacterales bacterium]